MVVMAAFFLEKSPLKSVKQGLSIQIPISPRGNVSWKNAPFGEAVMIQVAN